MCSCPTRFFCVSSGCNPSEELVVKASVHLNEEIGSVVAVNVKGAFCMARRFGDRING